MKLASTNRFEMPTPGSRLWGKVLFSPEVDAQGDTGSEGVKEPTYSKEHVDKIIRERDQAKTKWRTAAEALGLEDEYVDDEENPGRRKLLIKGLDDLKKLREQRTADAEEGQKKNGKWEERKAELEQQHSTKVQKLTQNYDRKLNAHKKVITDLVAASPLREALMAEGAYDADGDGRFADQVKLLQPTLRVDFEEDEETGELKPVVLVLGDDGKPLLDGKGDPVAIRQFVKGWLDKRPNQRKANFRPGPAGGKGAPYGVSGRAPSTQEHGYQTAAAFFGKPTAA